MSEYVVIIERDEAGGYSAWAPDLPGVVAAAASYDETLTLMREAVELHLEGLREDGQPIPAPAAVGAVTIVAALRPGGLTTSSTNSGGNWMAPRPLLTTSSACAVLSGNRSYRSGR